jgi:hypothetical protein
MDNKKHGRWLARYPLGKEFGAEYMCSNCRSGTFGESNNRDVCKHCGAIMDISAEYVDIEDVISAINEVCEKQLWGTRIRQAFLDAIKTIPITIKKKH